MGLVVGAAAYAADPLVNAVGDAQRVAAAMASRGFDVTLVTNPDARTLADVIETFRTASFGADLAMIYLAGHAVERHGTGYFLPVDFPFPVSPGSLRHAAVGLDEFVQATHAARSRIVVLDACRDWPSAADERLRLQEDLDAHAAAERDWPNLLLAYATSATGRAGDGKPGEGSAFSSSLCRHMLDHALTVDECFRRISQDVVAARPAQQPWTYSSLRGSLSFSDLPRFAVLQRHMVPNPTGTVACTWTAPVLSRDAVIVGLGDHLAWRVSIAGFERVRHHTDAKLAGAADLVSGLVLSTEDGDLALPAIGGEEFPVGVAPTFGVTAHPGGGSALMFGARSVISLTATSSRLQVAVRHTAPFDIYCCLYLSTSQVWAAGGGSLILEMAPGSRRTPVREVARVRGPVNAMTMTSDGSTVYVVGQAGVAIALSEAGAVTTELLPGRPLTIKAAIRDKLVGRLEDDQIRDFLFDPASLEDELLEEISEVIAQPAYHSCAVAPRLPILAIGTEESTVLLLDTRDGQIFQEIELPSGSPTTISGLHFIEGNLLVCVDGRGQVVFLSYV